MIRHRSNDQVLASAGQIDDLLAAGIDPALVTELVATRAAWQRTGVIRSITLTPAVTSAIAEPAVLQWDAVFTAAVRRALTNRRTRDLA